MSKTIFILAGGNERESIDYGHCLAQEVAKYSSSLRILSCFFASPAETWAEKSRSWQHWFSDYFTRPFDYDYARVSTLLQQIEAANVIYFHGGDTRSLLKHLPNTIELRQCLRGKIIIGSSAGANMLSTNFWSSTRGVVGKGRAVLDQNIMVHYGASEVGGYRRTEADWAREEAEFQKSIGNDTITRLPEGKFVVIVRENL